jgi:UDP-N-acetylmuramoyl-tripeptide--D-alanyl-D-alanine ligase
MLELGTEEERLHREIGAFAAGLPVDVLLTVGKAGAYIADEARKTAACETGKAGNDRASGKKTLQVICCADKAQAKEAMKVLPRENAAYLFKASRGMALEELVDELL